MNLETVSAGMPAQGPKSSVLRRPRAFFLFAKNKPLFASAFSLRDRFTAVWVRPHGGLRLVVGRALVVHLNKSM